MHTHYDIVVIGAGASGLMAAITAASYNREVLIIEKNEKAGRKLLATGNGRCNLTNSYQDLRCYNCNNKDFVNKILSVFSWEDTVRFFRKSGMLTKDKDGYIYPKSMQAQTVLDTLINCCKNKNIRIKFNTTISKIIKEKDYFKLVCSNEYSFIANKVIMACGSKAAKNLGGDSIGYVLAKELGHSLIKPLPSLCGVRVNTKENKSYKEFFKEVSGVRNESTVRLFIDNEFINSSKGELQLTDYGLSGIVVFQLSGQISIAIDNKKKTKLIVDFIPDLSLNDILAYGLELKNNIENITLFQFLCSMLNTKMVKGLLVLLCNKIKYLNKDTLLSQLSNIELEEIIQSIKNSMFLIDSANDYDKAQVCTGGIDISQIKYTMESKKINNLYFCGEILDIDGICGGYNLQIAWSTGYIAGKNASIECTTHNADYRTEEYND